MRKAVRAVIIKSDQLLVMHRNKFGQEYYTLVGGSVDMGETLEHALIREVYEETSLTVTGMRLVFIEEAGEPYGDQYIYFCNINDGEVKLPPDSIEAKINELGKNLYTPLWLPISRLGSVPFVSEPLKSALLKAYTEGFPTQPVEINKLAFK